MLTLIVLKLAGCHYRVEIYPVDSYFKFEVPGAR